jgi:iron complex outermembrane receptor protein
MPMRMTAYLLSAVATAAIVTPAFAQQATSTVEAQASPSQGTANASVAGQTNAATDADTTRAASANAGIQGNASDIVITATFRAFVERANRGFGGRSGSASEFGRQ